ncbi:MAG: AAA family ATPase [Gemmatimonadaceae bacterium]
MVRLKALGQSAIEVGDTRIGPEQPYLFAIALYMIVERGKRIPRQALVDLIWPNVRDEKRARQRFRQALLRLRECGLPITGENGTLLLDRAAAHTDFDTLASPDTIRIGQSLEFLPHYAPRISDRFLDWVETHRSRVHATVQRHFLARMQQARSRGDWAEIDELATECLRLDPYNEEAVMAHAECAVMRGSKREALSILDSYMEALGTQVGTIGLPAKILRTRIAERLTDQRYAMISEEHFIGRTASMELLLGLLREAKRGAGSAALIWGEPGIGKSRLVQELTQVAGLDDAQIVSTKCHPTDAGRPLSAFADFVPMLKTLPGALGCSAQTLSLLQRLTDRNKGDSFPPQEAGDAAFLAATIRRAVFDLVDAVADEGMLVMVIEDVHWLDEPSWAILSAMVEWSTTRTLLILMTSRTAHATETKVAHPDRGFHAHHLLPLADVDSVTLIDKLAADDANPLPDGVREWSVAAAEGNPFYLRELVRHWVETQQVFGVPRSLAELIEARLNRLSSLALRVLQLCAAFGKHSSFARLEKATGYQNHVLLDAIEELSSAAMLASDKPGVAVKHDLLATAALTRLGGATLKLVHRQVATVLEAEINEKHTAALMWDCAEHWQCAGETEYALATVRLCANHLHSVGQSDQSIELYEKALAICVTVEERLQTMQELAASLRTAGKWSRLKEQLRDFVTLLTKEHHPDSLRDYVDLLRVEVDWRLRIREEQGLEWLVSFASDQSKLPEYRLGAVRIGMIRCSEQGRRDHAQAFYRIVEELEAADRQEALVAHIRMIYHADFGNGDLALKHAKDLLALEGKIGEPASLTRARCNVTMCYQRFGLIEESKLLCKQNLAFAIEHRMDNVAAFASLQLGLIALQEEDFAGAERWHAQATNYVNARDERIVTDHFSYIAARIGLHREETEAVEHFLSIWSDVSHCINFRTRQTVASIRCLAQITSKRCVERDLVEALHRDFEQYCDLGQQDFCALATYQGLRAIGEQVSAVRMLTQYVTYKRRERGPLPPSLAHEVELLNLA